MTWNAKLQMRRANANPLIKNGRKRISTMLLSDMAEIDQLVKMLFSIAK
jgi:hypothetical protein